MEIRKLDCSNSLSLRIFCKSTRFEKKTKQKAHSHRTTRSKIQELLVFETHCWFGGATARECEIAGTRSPKVLGILGFAIQVSRNGEQGVCKS